MANINVFDNTYQMMGKALDVSARRHNVISSNISNMDTIGYKARKLDFHETLAAEMSKNKGGLAKTNEKHFKFGTHSPMEAQIVEQDDEFNLDPVNIDTEMGNLMENNMKYRTSVEMMLRKISMVKHAISEGGQ